MLPSASIFKGSFVALLLTHVACTSVSSAGGDASQARTSRKPLAGEIRIAPPPNSNEPAQRERKDLVDQVLEGDKGTELNEIRLPTGAMGLQPGDVTGDPITLSRERSRLQRTDAEIAAVSGGGELEKKLGDFDRILGVTENEGRPLSPSFTTSTKKIRELFAQKRYEDALVETNELLLHYSKSSLLWTMKGTLHLRLSQSDLSLAAYEKAFDLEPTPRLLAQIEQLRKIVSDREAMKLKNIQVIKPSTDQVEGTQND